MALDYKQLTESIKSQVTVDAQIGRLTESFSFKNNYHFDEPVITALPENFDPFAESDSWKDESLSPETKSLIEKLKEEAIELRSRL